MSDALKAIGSLDIRYADLLNPVEDRDPDEIISTLSAGLDKLGGE